MWGFQILRTTTSPVGNALCARDNDVQRELAQGLLDEAQLLRQVARVLVVHQYLTLAQNKPRTTVDATLRICLAHEQTLRLHEPDESLRQLAAGECADQALDVTH